MLWLCSSSCMNRTFPGTDVSWYVIFVAVRRTLLVQLRIVVSARFFRGPGRFPTTFSSFLIDTVDLLRSTRGARTSHNLGLPKTTTTMTMYMYLAAKMFALISVVVAVSAATDRASSLRRRLDTPTSAPTTFDDYLGQCEPALWVDGRAYFNTLSALQQCAVARVGYTEEGWDTDQEPILDSCNAAWICNNRNLNEHDTGEPKNQRELVDTTYDDMEWADLVSVDGCQNLQEQFQLLGVTEGSWNDFYECYTWGELGGTMQQYSRDLGYNRTVWNNGCDTPPCVATEGKAWADLTDLEQAAAEAFGYGCFTWDGYPDPAQNWWMDITCAD